LTFPRLPDTTSPGLSHPIHFPCGTITDLNYENGKKYEQMPIFKNKQSSNTLPQNNEADTKKNCRYSFFRRIIRSVTLIPKMIID
jgi:hypothetical protein